MTKRESLDDLSSLVSDLITEYEALLGRNKDSSYRRAAKIRSLTSTSSQLSTFVRALARRIPQSSPNSGDSSSTISDVHQKVSSFIPDTPVSQDQFLKWLPGKMQQYIATIRSFQKRINECQKKIEDTMQKLNRNQQKSKKREKLERQLELELTLNSQLKEEHKRLMNELEETQKSESKLNEIVEVDQAEMDSMRKKLAKFSKLVTELQKHVDISQLNADVRALLESRESVTDIPVSSIEKRNEQPSYEDLNAQIQILKQQLSDVTREREELAEKLSLVERDSPLHHDNDSIRLLREQLQHESSELDKARQELARSKAHASANTDSLYKKIKSLHAKCKELQEEMYKLQERNQELINERTKFESDLAKTKGSLTEARHKLREISGTGGVTAETVVAQLSEVLSVPYTGKCTESEITKLIKIVESEHRKLKQLKPDKTISSSSRSHSPSKDSSAERGEDNTSD